MKISVKIYNNGLFEDIQPQPYYPCKKNSWFRYCSLIELGRPGKAQKVREECEFFGGISSYAAHSANCSYESNKEYED